MHALGRRGWDDGAVHRFAWLTKIKSYLLPGATLAAGIAALAVGALPEPAFAELADRTVPILSFVLAMSLVTELLDEAGLFRVVTDRLAALGRGRVFILWLLVIAVATVFARQEDNEATGHATVAILRNAQCNQYRILDMSRCFAAFTPHVVSRHHCRIPGKRMLGLQLGGPKSCFL